MTTKTGKISARNMEDAKKRLKHENPGWRVINIKKHRVIYYVTLEKIKKRRKK